jgi:hypothetical protein
MSNQDLIFLSYARPDLAFAHKLATDLINHEVNLWMDRLKLQFDEDPGLKIREAIDNCVGMIVVLSTDYVEKEVYLQEVSRGQGSGCEIIPILVHTMRAESLPVLLRDIDDTDFRDWRNEDEYQEKLNELLLRVHDAKKGVTLNPVERHLHNLIAIMEGSSSVRDYVNLQAQIDRDIHYSTRETDPDRTIYSGLMPSGQQPLPDQTLLDRSGKVTLSDAREAATLYPQFVIVGEPGAGKTTTLRNLVMEAAYSHLQDPITTPLPIYVPLREWPESKSFAEFLQDSKDHWPFDFNPTALLFRVEVSLYLDGLDEMGARGPDKAKQLGKWIRDNDVPYVIITCRTSNYEGNLNLGLPTVLIEAMDEDKVRQFAKHYLKEKAEGFLAHILPEGEATDEDVRHLSRLASNPFLQSALIEVYLEYGTGNLPQNSGELFKILVQNLWERENKKKTQGWVPLDKMIAAFGRLAFAMIDEDQPVVDYKWVFPQLTGRGVLDKHDDLQGEENARQLLEAAQSANLIDLAGHKVRFYHQLMQEYFAAEGLLARPGLGVLSGPYAVYLDILQEYEDGSVVYEAGRYYSKWNQVVIALCGIVDPDMVVNHIIGIDPYLAAWCVEAGARVSASVVGKVVKRLLNALHNPSNNDFSWTGADQLTLLKRDEPHKSHIIPTENEWTRIVSSQALMLVGAEAAPRLLEFFQRTEGIALLLRAAVTVRPGFIAALRTGDEEARDLALQALTQVALPIKPELRNRMRDFDDGVRDVAIVTLRIIERELPSLYQRLIDNQQTAVGAESQNPVSYIRLGDLHFLVGQYPEALINYQEAANIWSDSVPLFDFSSRLEMFT